MDDSSLINAAESALLDISHREQNEGDLSDEEECPRVLDTLSNS